MIRYDYMRIHFNRIMISKKNLLLKAQRQRAMSLHCPSDSETGVFALPIVNLG